MAIADFGGSALGRPIEFLTADHRNKPNIGAGKFREWADTKWLTMLLGGSNTTPPIAGDRKIPFFRDRGRRRFADRQRLKRVHNPLRIRRRSATARPRRSSIREASLGLS